MKRRILILGGGVMQLPPIRAARRIGLYVLVADGNAQAPGRAEADEFLHIDLKDQERLFESAARMRRGRGLDGVFTAGTDFSTAVAYITDKLGLPGTSYESALDATDKFRMRERLRDAGVRVPAFALLAREELSGDLPARVRELGLPVVVKPADSMGARGVVRADTWSEALQHAKTAVPFSRTGRVVVEGLIPGPEFSIDAIVYEQSIQITGIADRHIRFEPYFIEVGHTIPSAADARVQETVIEEFKRGVRALGIGPGAAKGDMKMAPDGPVVGEIAARLSGGYMSGWTYPLSSGVNLSEIGIRVALGEAPGTIRTSWRKTSAERAIISIPGVLSRIDGVSSAQASPLVKEVFLTRSIGDSVQFPRNNVEKVGNVIAVDEEHAVAIHAAERAVAAVVAEVEAGNELTEHFLFDRPDRETAHFAYPQNASFVLGETMETGIRPLWEEQKRATCNLESMRVWIDTDRARECDWSYRSIEESLRLFEGRTGVRAVIVDSQTELSPHDRVLFHALCRGGLPGLLYATSVLLPAGSANILPG